jgi:adenylosuccinate synthase
MNFIGSGVVFNVPQFFKELQDLSEKGLEVHDRIRVSDRVHIDLQLHIAADGLEEQELGGWFLIFGLGAYETGWRLLTLA